MKRSFLVAALVCSTAMLQAQSPNITVQLLGTGVPYVNTAYYVASGRVLAGLLITAGTERMMFDVGQGTVTRLLQSGGPVMDPNIGVDKLFISHLHSDHIADLSSLYLFGWLVGRDNIPLRVWGPGASANQPIGTSSMMQQLRVAYDSDVVIRCCLWTQPDAFNLDPAGIGVDNNVIELWDGVVYQNNGVTVTAFLVDHDPVEPAYGFRVDYNGNSVVFSGDTTFNQNLINHSQNADLLIHEIWGLTPAASTPEIYAYHCPPETCFAPVMSMTKPKMAVMTHIAIPNDGSTANDLVTRVRASGYSGPLTIGQDLMTITVSGSNIVVTPAPGPSTNNIPALGEPAEVYRAKHGKKFH